MELLSEDDYRIRLEAFEGPLDLLLYLIRRDEVDIFDISIERVTHQYLEYLDAMQVLDLDVAGDFLVMAANLLYIKSRSLLPQDQLPEEDASQDDDPRWELIRSLIEYKKFKEAADLLGNRAQLEARIFPRREPDNPAPRPETAPERVNVLDLIAAFERALRRAAAQGGVGTIPDENFTVGQKLEAILAVTLRTPRISFDDLFPAGASRTEIVVTFLALLELIRLRYLAAEQEEPFGEITLIRLPDPIDTQPTGEDELPLEE